MEQLHSLLCRQLRRQFGEKENIPKNLQPLIEAVNSAYLEFDNDRELVERSLELSSNELIQANTNMRAIFYALPDLFLLTDSSNIVIDYKAGKNSFIELAPKYVLNKNIQDIHTLDVGKTLSSSIYKAHDTNDRVTVEYEIITNSKQFYVEANIFPVAGEKTAVLIRDITARKQAETSLQNSDQRLRMQNKLLVDLASNKNLTEGSIEYALEVILSAAARGLSVERASIWFFSKDNSKLVCAKLYEKRTDSFSSGTEIVASDYPEYFNALKTNRTIVADNAHKHHHTREFSESYLGPIGISSMLDASIHVGRRLVGVFCCENVGPVRTWAPEEINFSSSMADFVSLALESRERQKVQNALTESEDKFRILAETTDSAIFVFRDRFLYVNPAMKEIFGYGSNELMYMGLEDLVHGESHSLVRQFKHQYQSGVTESVREEVRTITKDGEERWLFLSTGLIQYEQQPAILATAFDITDRKQIEDQLRHQAFHDKLTGLPNRALFTDRVEHVVQRYRRRNDYLFAVLFVDLDRFKVINDSLGHQVGDELLIEIGRRLCECVRPSDTVTRMGGDEFTILLEDLESIDCALQAAKRIQQKLAEPFTVLSQAIITTASIGIALSSKHYTGADQILRDADIAMYRAKCNGKSRYEIFDAEMHERALKLMKLENDLRNAVQNNEFVLYYQPIVELSTGVITGLESLIRWEHPERGMVPPNEFIPLAEETGMILDIGEWVLMEACRQIKLWTEQFNGMRLPEVNINVSGMQLSHGNITQRIIDAVETFGIRSAGLKLEFTESMVMEDPKNVSTIITKLKEVNVRAAIDDFGIGYSSLSYLHKFPIDTLKIDRSFVNLIGPNQSNTAIVNAIVVLAHNLGLDVVAEGVETEQQLRYLQEIGCDFGQGYYYAKPMPACQVTNMLANAGQTRKLKRNGISDTDRDLEDPLDGEAQWVLVN